MEDFDIVPAVLEGKSITLHAPATEVFTKTTNLKAFYKELHDFLVDKKFKDTISPGGHAKMGEQVDAKTLNRTGDMFEKQFITIDNGWAKEIEIRWEAVKKLNSKYGSVTFNLDLVCRDMRDKEILDGNSKKVMQIGKWEFRNKLIYKSTIVEKFLNKVPIVKNSDTLKEMYLRNIYKDKLEEEVMIVFTKVKPGIYKIIHKYFR